MKYRNFLFVVVLLSVFISCKKNSAPSQKTPGTNVYVSGYSGASVTATTTLGTYWKNGVPVNIPNVAGLGPVATSGADVYILAGATYWKNGVPLSIPNEMFTHTIVVQGSDVYVTGKSSTAGGAIYWKNGVEVNLNTPNAYTMGLAVSGNDVYVAGAENDKAVYWKNGQVVNLPDGGYMANAIAVSGSDVYVGGNSASGGDVYWKNGVEMSLGLHATVTSMTVSGNDVYFAGGVSGTSGSLIKPVYWKNGQVVYLTGSSNNASSIAVSGQDVYVAGGMNGYGYAVYWKNGVIDTLGIGATFGIAIGQ
jgi:hypothetical protein